MPYPLEYLSHQLIIAVPVVCIINKHNYLGAHIGKNRYNSGIREGSGRVVVGKYTRDRML